MRFLLPLIVLFVCGCQTKPLAPHPPAPLPMAEVSARPNARIAAVVGHYTLGAYIDPEDNLIRHEAHEIQRVEMEARWDLRAAPSEVAPPQTEPVSAVESSPAAPPAHEAQLVATPAPLTQAPVAVAAVVTPPVDSSPRPEPEAVQVVTVNADGFLDLTALPRAADADVNPFAVRSVRTEGAKEISLLVGGLVQGSNPCALINGSPVQPGDTLESLTLVRLEPDAALFRHDGKLIRLPVATKPARLRIAL